MATVSEGCRLRRSPSTPCIWLKGLQILKTQEPFLSIDDSLLNELEPQFFKTPSLMSELLGRQDRRQLTELAKLMYHMSVGSPGPAIFISHAPFRVLCYAKQIDKCLCLEFSKAPACAAELEIGARLLCVNQFDNVPVDDLVGGSGPEEWKNFAPLVADLLSNESYRIAEILAEIPEADWERCDALSETYFARGVLPRKGTPSQCGFPRARQRVA